MILTHTHTHEHIHTAIIFVYAQHAHTHTPKRYRSTLWPKQNTHLVEQPVDCLAVWCRLNSYIWNKTTIGERSDPHLSIPQPKHVYWKYMKWRECVIGLLWGKMFVHANHVFIGLYTSPHDCLFSSLYRYTEFISHAKRKGEKQRERERLYTFWVQIYNIIYIQFRIRIEMYYKHTYDWLANTHGSWCDIVMINISVIFRLSWASYSWWLKWRLKRQMRGGHAYKILTWVTEKHYKQDLIWNIICLDMLFIILLC